MYSPSVRGAPIGGRPCRWRGGCTHLLFEERPSEGDPLLELFALALVLRLGLHLDLALVRRQQLVLLLQTLLLLLRLRHLRLVQLYLHHNKNGKFHDLLMGGSHVEVNYLIFWLAGYVTP